MTIKHRVIKEFQYITSDKKIVVLKIGTILENYKYITKLESINIDSDVINSNPDFFSIVDWKFELLSYLKQNKIPQPSLLSKKLIPFIEETFIIPSNSVTEFQSRLEELNKQNKKIGTFILPLKRDNEIKGAMLGFTYSF